MLVVAAAGRARTESTLSSTYDVYKKTAAVVKK